MGLLARNFDRLPHHAHIAAAAAKAPAAAGWLPIVVVAVAIFVAGMWWASTRT